MEHPRSSTTDNVECFFSILRETVGKDFTLKQASYTAVGIVKSTCNYCSFYTVMEITIFCTHAGILWMEENQS